MIRLGHIALARMLKVIEAMLRALRSTDLTFIDQTTSLEITATATDFTVQGVRRG